MSGEEKRPGSGQEHAAEKTEGKETLDAPADNNNSADQLADYVRCVFEPDDLVELRPCKPKPLKGTGERRWLLAKKLVCIGSELHRLNSSYNVFVGINPRRAAGSGVLAKDCDRPPI